MMYSCCKQSQQFDSRELVLRNTRFKLLKWKYRILNPERSGQITTSGISLGSKMALHMALMVALHLAPMIALHLHLAPMVSLQSCSDDCSDDGSVLGFDRRRTAWTEDDSAHGSEGGSALGSDDCSALALGSDGVSAVMLRWLLRWWLCTWFWSSSNRRSCWCCRRTAWTEERHAPG